jgi:dihydroneopterin aldolase
MSDAIFLKGLALHAYHGVMQHEAKVGQTFHVDLQL